MGWAKDLQWGRPQGSEITSIGGKDDLPALQSWFFQDKCQHLQALPVWNLLKWDW